VKITGWTQDQIDATPAVTLDHLLLMDDVNARVEKALAKKAADEVAAKAKRGRHR
jgi:hypothetical protein